MPNPGHERHAYGVCDFPTKGEIQAGWSSKAQKPEPEQMQMDGPREASRVFIGGRGKMTDGKDEMGKNIR